MKHILVTGGNGFIGRYVAEELQTRGYIPAVFDRKLPERPSGLSGAWPPSFFGDIKDPTLVSEAVSHVDGVIHLAGVLGTQETIENPLPAAETNILGGLNVIGACAQYDVPLVNIAVGNWWMANTYSITKNSIERFVEMKRTFEDRRMTSVRALNAYGPRQVPAEPFGPSRVRKIMPSFICRALTGKPIEIYGSGEQVMDMIFVRDVARVLCNTLEFVASSDDVMVPEVTVEAGTGRRTTVREIADLTADAIESQTGKPVKVAYLPMRPGEPPDSIVLAEPSTVRQVGIDPATFTSLEDGIAITVEYYREYLGEQ